MIFNITSNINKKHVVLMVLIGLLAFGNVFFAVKFFLKVKETQRLQKEVSTQQINTKVVSFLSLFIQKVLKSDEAVSFEDRLQLENAIRDINDPEILATWERFTGGTNEAQIQQGVKDLLTVLVKKVNY